MDEKVFDRDGVMERLDGDMDLFKELLEVFDAECPKMLSAIEDAIKASDAPRVGMTAHSMKGALGNIGASKASAIAKKLEFAGKGNAIQEAPAMFKELVAAVHDFKSVVAEI